MWNSWPAVRRLMTSSCSEVSPEALARFVRCHQRRHWGGVSEPLLGTTPRLGRLPGRLAVPRCCGRGHRCDEAARNLDQWASAVTRCARLLQLNPRPSFSHHFQPRTTGRNRVRSEAANRPVPRHHKGFGEFSRHQAKTRWRLNSPRGRRFKFCQSDRKVPETCESPGRHRERDRLERALHDVEAVRGPMGATNRAHGELGRGRHRPQRRRTGRDPHPDDRGGQVIFIDGGAESIRRPELV